MSKYLLMFVLLTGSSFAAKSQPSSDTLCFPVATVQKLLIAAKQKEYADSLNAVYRQDVNILQSSIATYRVKDSLQAHMADTYQAMANTQQQQRLALEGQIGVLNSEVRKWKRKTTWTAIGGVFLTALTTALFIFK